jgi:L-threonylcarbamoyladenylate synthase
MGRVKFAGRMTGDTELMPTHTPALFAAAVRRAAELLRAGEVVALPTETVYGLAADALNPAAVKKIFEIKGRPAHNPIIVHVAGIDLARTCVRRWPTEADALARAFWPGPLTLVLPRSERVPDLVAAGGDTVGVRWPSHPLIQAVIRACGFPLAAPSANPSNRISPTNAMHVRRNFDGQIPLIVDGGPAQVGIESTVIDLSSAPPVILRAGMIHKESLRAVLGEVASSVTRPAAEMNERLRSPGQLPQHYAPRARLIVLAWQDDADLRSQINILGVSPAACHVIAHGILPSAAGLGSVSVIPHDAEAYARAIYAELHRCDDLGAKVILVERVPDAPQWHAIADRLSRASG